MAKYKVGDVVSIEFPFSDLRERKRRPGLVLASGDLDVLLARLTTHASRDAADVALRHWTAVGLPKASTVRLTKLLTVDARLVHHKIGHVHPEDANAIAEALKKLMTAIEKELRK